MLLSFVPMGSWTVELLPPELSWVNYRELFSRARSRELALSPPAGLFHAARVSLEDGRIALGYDFSSRDQIEDFYDKSTTGGAIRWLDSREAIEFVGEARFGVGDPFRGALSVEALIDRDGFRADSPNVNVALWTREDDRVTATLDVRDFRGRGGRDDDDDDGGTGGAADYIAVGHGYWIELDLDAIGPVGLRRLAGSLRGLLPSFVQEPVFIVLAGEAGRRLHSDLRREVIWDEPVGNRWTGRSRFQVRSERDAFEWSVDGRDLPFGASKAASRLVAPSDRRGSVTFFTNGEAVRFAEILISGELDPEWLEERLRDRVREELERLDPSAGSGRGDASR